MKAGAARRGRDDTLREVAAMRVVAVVAAALGLLPVGTFRLDPAASAVTFVVRDNRGGFRGEARRVEATVQVEETAAGFSAAVEARIDARSLTTGLGLRDAQMHRAFLQSDRYPTILFRGSVTPVDPVTGLSFRALVRGRLTIRDVSREVEFPVRVVALRDAYLAEGGVTVRMSDFGIPLPRFLIFVAEDPVEVTLRLRLQAVP
jgi:polyisoprenoid-binding protein YceI